MVRSDIHIKAFISFFPVKIGREHNILTVLRIGFLASEIIPNGE